MRTYAIGAALLALLYIGGCGEESGLTGGVTTRSVPRAQHDTHGEVRSGEPAMIAPPGAATAEGEAVALTPTPLHSTTPAVVPMGSPYHPEDGVVSSGLYPDGPSSSTLGWQRLKRHLP